MDIKQLEAFVKVAEEGSFSKAAKRLQVTQPTISSHIASLESELGCRVLERLSTETVMTDTGKVLYNYARKIVTLRDQALATCKVDDSRGSGVIRIAASTIPYQYALPVVTAEFHLKYPTSQFRLSSSDSTTVATEVLRGAVDLGMSGAVMSGAGDELIYDPFMEDKLVVVTPLSGSDSQGADPVFSLGNLLQAPFIIREPGSGTRLETEAYLREQGLDESALNIVAQMNNPNAIIRAVSQGLGISVVSRLSAVDYERFGQIRIFDLEGRSVRRTIYLVRHSSRLLSPMAEAFVRFINRTD